MLSFKDHIQYANRAGVPLLSVATLDEASCVRSILSYLPGRPSVVWDCARGVLPANEEGQQVADKFGEVFNAAWFLSSADNHVPEDGLVFFMGADMLLEHNNEPDPAIVQAILNLRDSFKADGRKLFLLSLDGKVPTKLRESVVFVDESLPDEKALLAMVEELDAAVCQASGRKPLTTNQKTRVVHAVSGLSLFAAEQAVAMAMRADGIDMDHLWQTWKKTIEQTDGLSVFRPDKSKGFESLGGLTPIKQYLRHWFHGRRPVRVIVWIDEVEKTGLAAREETSGTNQDQEGVMLQWFQDFNVFGVMLLGVPGAGKSAICKATGAEFDCIVIRMDLGAMQGSLVGQSQQRVRRALKTIEAVGGEDVMVLATSNRVDGLSSAMRSRFTDTFFFDLPSDAELAKIWEAQLKTHPDSKAKRPKGVDEGWVGRNVEKCVQKAWQMDLPLEDAAEWIVPVAELEADEIERLRNQAHGRFLSAQSPGVYRKPEKKKGRKLAVHPIVP